MNKILVTGASGLVGGRLLQSLLGKRDWQVLGLTRSSAQASLQKNITIAAIDWTDMDALQEACNGMDAIVHLAAMNEPDCETNPQQALNDNSFMTLRLVQAAVNADVKRFIYVSTAKVYGANLQGVVTEKTPTRPLRQYALTHRFAEDYVLAAHAKGDISGLVLRLSNSIGVPASVDVNCWMLIANDFCRQAVADKKIVLSGTGEQWRNFIPLADVVDGLAFGISMPDQAVGDGLFNLGGAKEQRILDIAHLVAARCEILFGFLPPITRVEPPQTNASSDLKYDCQKIKNAGFSAHGDLNFEIDGLLRMCQSEGL